MFSMTPGTPKINAEGCDRFCWGCDESCRVDGYFRKKKSPRRRMVAKEEEPTKTKASTEIKSRQRKSAPKTEPTRRRSRRRVEAKELVAFRRADTQTEGKAFYYGLTECEGRAERGEKTF